MNDYGRRLRDMEAKATSQQGYRAPVQRLTGRGRPKLNIEEQQLRFLLEANFSGVDIAKTLGVSRSTVYERFR